MITTDQIIDDVLRRELHQSDRTWGGSLARLHAADKGGWTRGGITAASWGLHMGWSRQATRAELDAITESHARAFYERLYVRPWIGYPDPLRLLLIDFGVTTSHRNVHRCLQRALRDMGQYSGPIDGIVGKQTKAALDAVTDARRLYLGVLEHRARHYLALAFDSQVRQFLRTHPMTQLHNALGWLARCLPFVYEAPAAGN